MIRAFQDVKVNMSIPFIYANPPADWHIRLFSQAAQHVSQFIFAYAYKVDISKSIYKDDIISMVLLYILFYLLQS